MFGLFRKKPAASPVRTSADLVYVSADAVADAVAAALTHARARGQRVALLTPFRAHAATVTERLARRGIAAAPVERSLRDAAPPDAVPVADYASLGLLLAGLTPPVVLFQIERHPLRVHDEAAEQTIAAHSTDDSLRVYLSLDDGVLAIFAGRVKELMASLGMPPGEPIEHPWVTRSIENAQEKLAKRVKHETPADSFDEWQARNLGG